MARCRDHRNLVPTVNRCASAAVGGDEDEVAAIASGAEVPAGTIRPGAAMAEVAVGLALAAAVAVAIRLAKASWTPRTGHKSPFPEGSPTSEQPVLASVTQSSYL